ncbi:hypothetical protein, partial [Bacillus subtilis]|uniref:hypothetical protein n=1 Tax=Bacillus subtilis TaxID=1423 RepID=UPI003F4CF300
RYYGNGLWMKEVVWLTGVTKEDLKRRGEKLWGGEKGGLRFGLGVGGKGEVVIVDEGRVGMES